MLSTEYIYYRHPHFAFTQAKRGKGIFVPAYHQTRNETDLLLTGLIPRTRLEVWHDIRWLCPIDPAFQEIMGSREELDVAVFRRHEKDAYRKRRIQAWKKKKALKEAGAHPGGDVPPTATAAGAHHESQDEDESVHSKSIVHQRSVHFVPRLRRVKTQGDLRAP